MTPWKNENPMKDHSQKMILVGLVGGGPSLKKSIKIYEPFFCTISDSCLSRREVQLLQLHEIVEIQPEDKQPSC